MSGHHLSDPRRAGSAAALDERSLDPRDVARIVDALLSGIERGELEATLAEVRFLRSVAGILVPAPPRA